MCHIKGKRFWFATLVLCIHLMYLYSVLVSVRIHIGVQFCVEQGNSFRAATAISVMDVFAVLSWKLNINNRICRPESSISKSVIA